MEWESVDDFEIEDMDEYKQYSKKQLSHKVTAWVPGYA